MAARTQRTETMVGFFIFVGLIILTWLILFFGGKTESYGETYTIEVAFADASGVAKGTPVNLAGAIVGRVSATPQLESGIAPKVRVPIAIDSQRQLPTNAVFRIESASMLGDKVVTIQIPAEPSQTLLAQGDTIAGGGMGGLDTLQNNAVAITEDARTLMADARSSLLKFDAALDDIRTVSGNLNQTVEQLNHGILSDRNVSSINRTLANIEDASLGARNASGDLKPVLADARIAMRKINNLTESAETTFQNIDRQLANVEPALQEAPETMRSIRRTADLAEGAVTEAERTFAKANKTLDSINGGDGLVSTLTSDEEVSTDTKTFVRNLRRYGILGYKDEETDEDDPRERFRGRRR